MWTGTASRGDPVAAILWVVFERVMSDGTVTIGPSTADDAQVLILGRAFQQYTDAECASTFLTTPAHDAYVAEVERFLVGPPRVLRTDVIWTKAR